MRKIEIPRMEFHPWHKWGDRKNIPKCGMPGVYVIAISEKDLEGCSVDWVDVSYIGMTNSQEGLYGRWKQFFNSIRGKKGHSGGKSIFSDLGHYNSWSKSLYVSAMPIECNVITPSKDDLIKMGWVSYLEYEAFSEFKKNVSTQGKPQYNSR